MGRSAVTHILEETRQIQLPSKSVKPLAIRWCHRGLLPVPTEPDFLFGLICGDVKIGKQVKWPKIGIAYQDKRRRDAIWKDARKPTPIITTPIPRIAQVSEGMPSDTIVSNRRRTSRRLSWRQLRIQNQDKHQGTMQHDYGKPTPCVATPVFTTPAQNSEWREEQRGDITGHVALKPTPSVTMQEKISNLTSPNPSPV